MVKALPRRLGCKRLAASENPDFSGRFLNQGDTGDFIVRLVDILTRGHRLGKVNLLQAGLYAWGQGKLGFSMLILRFLSCFFKLPKRYLAQGCTRDTSVRRDAGRVTKAPSSSNERRKVPARAGRYFSLWGKIGPAPGQPRVVATIMDAVFPAGLTCHLASRSHTPGVT